MKDRTGKTAQVFIRNGSETALHCGPITNRGALRLAMGCVVDDALETALACDEDQELRLEVVWMTPEEVAAIPEI